MKISKEGFQTLIDSESSEQTVYIDQAGLPTIGVGHCLSQSELSSGKIELSDGSIIDIRNKRISKRNIERLLQDDLISRERVVNRLVKVPLNQGQFDALVHFVFNVGNGAFKNSTLLKKLNRGDYNAVPNEIRKWNIITVAGKKQVSKGLANRREVECSLWDSCSADSPKVSPHAEKKESNRTEKPVYKSKIIATSIATVATYLVTKYGIDIPKEFQAEIESAIVVGGLVIIAALRKWFTDKRLT